MAFLRRGLARHASRTASLCGRLPTQATKPPASAGWAPSVGPPGMATSDGSLKSPSGRPEGLSISEQRRFAEIAKAYLLYFVLPLWIAAGICDWFCHRRARIETNAGPKESVIHLVMMSEAGIAVLAGLFFEVNSLILLVMLIAWAPHEATAMWDLVYANAQREVNAIEQKVHDYLAVIPLLALSFVLVIHWTAFLAVFGLGEASPDWSLRPRMLDVPPAYFWTLMGAMALNFLLYVEELWRGLRDRGQGPQIAPSQPPRV